MTVLPDNDTEESTVTIAVRKRAPEAAIETDSETETPAGSVEQEKEELNPTRGVTIQPLTHQETPDSPLKETDEQLVEKKDTSPEVTVVEAKKPIKDQKQAEVDSALVVSELVNSKKYFLPIKEKHSSSIFHLEQTKKHRAVKFPKKKKPEPQQKIPKVIKKRSAGTTAGLFIGLFVLVAGSYLAIDYKLIDVGWTPPFSIANR